MDCPACGHDVVVFRVPATLRDHAPGETAALCTRCLTLQEAADAALGPASDRPGDPDFSAIIDAFPEDDAGAAMALGVGLIVDSLALNRAAIGDCMAYVSDHGVDPWLVLERLAASGAIQSEADLERARRQLQQLLE
jgi:hypothetical protein